MAIHLVEQYYLRCSPIASLWAAGATRDTSRGDTIYAFFRQPACAGIARIRSGLLETSPGRERTARLTGSLIQHWPVVIELVACVYHAASISSLVCRALPTAINRDTKFETRFEMSKSKDVLGGASQHSLQQVIAQIVKRSTIS
jgi:hypothetical protein